MNKKNSDTDVIDKVLTEFPNRELQDQVRQYLLYRSKLSLSEKTVKTDLILTKQLGQFLSDVHPALKDLCSFPEELLTHDLKHWMMKRELPLFRYRTLTSTQKQSIVAAPLICFLKTCIRFAIQKCDLPEQKKDVWDLMRLDIPLRQNPIDIRHKIDFRGILQPEMREEVKQACYHLLIRESVNTVCRKASSAKYFSIFLSEHFPEMKSFTEISRAVIEDYLVFLHTDCFRQETYAYEISSLKNLLKEIGMLTDTVILENLFLKYDAPKRMVPLYRTYSDAELSRLHNCILQLPDQLARMLFIHELLGTRISDTLTLRMDALKNVRDEWILCIDQVKTRFSYYKPVNDMLVQLLKACIAYTKEHSPDSPYIFPDEDDPHIPFQYSRLRNQLLRVYRSNNLVDDHGEPMRPSTHIFRHTYGQKLTELGIEDDVIARLLGHTNTKAVKYYRKISDRRLAEETKVLREHMDHLIRQAMKNWK